MVTFVLDASAVLRLLDREAGMNRVREIHNRHLTGEAIISSMHFGEIIGVFYRRHGLDNSEREIAELRALQLTVIPVTANAPSAVPTPRPNTAYPLSLLLPLNLQAIRQTASWSQLTST